MVENSERRVITLHSCYRVTGILGNICTEWAKASSPFCLYEEGEIIDDAEHSVFECARWQSYCSEVTSTIGRITANIGNGSGGGGGGGGGVRVG